MRSLYKERMYRYTSYRNRLAFQFTRYRWLRDVECGCKWITWCLSWIMMQLKYRYCVVLWSHLPNVWGRKLNTLRQKQNCRKLSDDIFECIFLNTKLTYFYWHFTKVCSQGPIYNIPTLVQTMAWRKPGDKPLSQPVTVTLLMHICVTPPKWMKDAEESCILFHKGWARFCLQLWRCI